MRMSDRGRVVLVEVDDLEWLAAAGDYVRLYRLNQLIGRVP